MSDEYKHQEYPKVMHGPNDAVRVVKSEEEEAKLGPKWIDGHKYWEAKKPKA